MRRATVLLTAVLLGSIAAGVTYASSASPTASATVLIRHQVQHCHAWSVNGGLFKEAQRLTLRRGATITFTNDDVMSHRLIELAGPRVVMRNGDTMPMGAGMHGSAAPGVMSHMGAATKITLAKAGVYRFSTRAGEDYMAGFETTGEDNVLTMTVTVR
jgi:plastocyanin